MAPSVGDDIATDQYSPWVRHTRHHIVLLHSDFYLMTNLKKSTNHDATKEIPWYPIKSTVLMISPAFRCRYFLLGALSRVALLGLPTNGISWYPISLQCHAYR